MQKFNVMAWPENDSEREYNPTWEQVVEAELIGDAQAEGERLFREKNPDLDHSKYWIHAEQV